MRSPVLKQVQHETRPAIRHPLLRTSPSHAPPALATRSAGASNIVCTSAEPITTASANAPDAFGGGTITNAETNTDWHRHGLPDRRYLASHLVNVEMTSASNATQAHVVHVATCGRATCAMRSGVDVGAAGRSAPVPLFAATPRSRRALRVDSPPPTRHQHLRQRRYRQTSPPDRFNRIGVAHQHHRCLAVRLAELGDDRELPLRNDIPLASARSDEAGSPTVGHRVGEWHTQFDHIRTRHGGACMVGKVLSSEGSPAVMNGISAFLLCALSAAKVASMRLLLLVLITSTPVRSVAPRYVCPVAAT